MTPQTPLTARELQAWLRARFPKEDERHEWKEWRSLKSHISGRKGEDLVSYISALANMDGGCVVTPAKAGEDQKPAGSPALHRFGRGQDWRCWHGEKCALGGSIESRYGALLCG